MEFPRNVSVSALARLALGAGGVVAGALTGDPTFAGLGSLAGGYLASRADAVEKEDADKLRESKNHHLQLLLAGAMREALKRVRVEGHAELFDAWDSLLDSAFNKPDDFLPCAIPPDLDAILDSANPHLDSNTFDEIETLLRSWLQAYESRNQSVVPAALPEIPPDLRAHLQANLLPAFELACADLLNRNDGTHARRAFQRRSLQELVATNREQIEKLDQILEKDALPIVRLRPPQPYDADRELEILRAENRSIPVVGRRENLDGLHAWLLSDDKVSVRIFTGRAGAGKTRLAYQFLEDLQSSAWDAGFLRGAGLEDLHRKHWQLPTVAIIDYAATATQPLEQWLAHLADHPPEKKLRLLLLEREAQTDSGWLRLLLDETGPRIADLLDPGKPLRVAAIDDYELRREILQETLAKLGASAKLPPTGKDERFDKRLAEPQWQDPLYLMMAALVANHDGGLPQALSLSRTDLAEQVAAREIDRIKRFLRKGSPPSSVDLLIRLAGVVTACQSMDFTLDDLIDIAKEESESLGIDAFPGGPREAATLLHAAVGARHAAPSVAAPAAPKILTSPIEPDIVGEAVLLRAFSGQKGTDAIVRAARRWDRRHASKVCASVTRTCQDFSSEKQQQPLDWVEAIIQFGETGDLGLLFELEDAMPHNTLVLRERAARLDELLLTRLTALAGEGDDPSLTARRARIANNLSVRLSDLGRREEALAHAEEAVRHYRALAAERPDAFLPNLATSLNNLANRLSDLGRRKEALEQAQEAVRIRRRLAQRSPDTFRPNLATSLSNLANRLSDLGRREEALAHAEEAVRHYRALAADRPDAFLPNLATSLNNLANRFSELDRREEALAHAQEAVRIRRTLAEQRPDAFLSDLAITSNNLAVRLSALSRREEALAKAQEAVRIYRALAQQRPNTFMPDLAKSLGLLGFITSSGDAEAALAPFAEAISLLSPYFVRSPQAHGPMLSRMYQDYIQTCQAANTEPTLELLAPIAETLQKLQPPDQP